MNNVAHVGHCHPAVVAAANAQTGLLNTNSRYLHPNIVDYARRLSATLPPPPVSAPAQHSGVGQPPAELKQVGERKWVLFWVNSGSEANDLALRLARAHTGRRGLLTVESAYHGHTVEVIHASPYKYDRTGGEGRQAWVQEAPLPCVHTGKHRGRIDDDAMGAAYAADVVQLLRGFAETEARDEAMQARMRDALAAASAAVGTDDAAAASHEQLLAWAQAAAAPSSGLKSGLSAFIMESILSCGGQVMPPSGYLRRVHAAVRAAGGVTIADEVQVGFGRVGSFFWAFQLQGEDVVPDIITLGKPMGNGFPVAAVITTPEVAASFAAGGMEYFNTFGGNPVSGAVALATLEAIQSGGLQAHAAAVGEVLLEGFRGLQASFPALIGSVRGMGLMVGLEMLRPARAGEDAGDAPAGAERHAHPAVYSHGQGTRVPDPALASRLKYGALRRFRHLLSTDGMADNVIKLKPPMAFTADNAREVVAGLRTLLEDEA